MIVLEHKTDLGLSLYGLLIAFGLLIALFSFGIHGEWTFLVVGCVLWILYMLISLHYKIYGKKYVLDETGITLYRYKKKKIYSYEELGYYLYRMDRPWLQQNLMTKEYHYIHIYNKRRIQIFTMAIPEATEPMEVIDFLSKYLEKYVYGSK